MTTLPSFYVGQLVSNYDLMNEFGCGNMGGMRRSKKTNTLILVSDDTKPLYKNVWSEGILHYTGMGKIGDQSLNFRQNKTLAESIKTNISVFLFEVKNAGVYIYRGRVVLCDAPYQSTQFGDDKIERLVWVFPLKIVK